MNGLVNSHMTRTPESVSVGKQRNDCLPLHNAVWMVFFFSISNPYSKVVFIVGEGSCVFCLVWNVLSDTVAGEWPPHKELENSGDSLCPEGTCCPCLETAKSHFPKDATEDNGKSPGGTTWGAKCTEHASMCCQVAHTSSQARAKIHHYFPRQSTFSCALFTNAIEGEATASGPKIWP